VADAAAALDGARQILMERFAEDAALAGELLVSAAASLTNAFTEMKAPFEAANPGATLVLNFAASGALLRQMEQGAPVDVFASADQETMDKAAALIDPASRIEELLPHRWRLLSSQKYRRHLVP